MEKKLTKLTAALYWILLLFVISFISNTVQMHNLKKELIHVEYAANEYAYQFLHGNYDTHHPD